MASKYTLLFALIAMLVPLGSYSQTTNRTFSPLVDAWTPTDRTLYVVDSVPLTKKHEEFFFWQPDFELETADVFSQDIITDRSLIKSLGYQRIDTLIYIFTNEYHNRPEALKLIPTGDKLNIKSKGAFLKSTGKPYSGPVICYYSSGRKRISGKFCDGELCDTVKNYYPDGKTMSRYSIYTNGILNGSSCEYYTNGKIKQTARYVDGKKEGAWTNWYSNGQVKGKLTYKSGESTVPKEDEPFWDALNAGKDAMKDRDEKKAVKLFTKALNIKPGYADAYFERGKARAQLKQFDDAIRDFDSAVINEPYQMPAIAGRVVAKIMKYKPQSDPTGTKPAIEMPAAEMSIICTDLQTLQANEKAQGFFGLSTTVFGLTDGTLKNAIERYCR